MPLQTAEEGSYINPAATASHDTNPEEPRPAGRLTNADFRKLMMTPRAPAPPPESGEGAGEGRSKEGAHGDDPKAQERRRRKSYYARIKREDQAKLDELSEKYRDRALERRDGRNPDYTQEEGPQEGQGAYRAVAPDIKGVIDAAERRKQMIQESKFLGGDMEHTHLVKGLDYALLQKVRSEIVFKEQAEETTEEKADAGSGDEATVAAAESKKIAFKTSMGRRIYSAIARSGPEFNDLFLPGRMAYSIDLEADDEIPTTVIRSKADLQGIENMQATFTSNDLVIQKLSQILSYLRTGRTAKKMRKKDAAAKKGGEGGAPTKPGDDSIYGDIGNYVPGGYDGKAADRDTLRNKERRGDRYEAGKDGNKGGRSYFESGRDDDRENRNRRGEEATRRADWRELEEGAGRAPAPQPISVQPPPADIVPKRKMNEDTFYTECYPDMAEMHDAIEDSDEEADYTKMDLGNRKGPIGRWDFDNTEDYSNYMNQKEALPKAAFQYGVKMADGRKTRRIPGSKDKDRNAELNREWQQISAIIKKKKDGGEGPAKRARY